MYLLRETILNIPTEEDSSISISVVEGLEIGEYELAVAVDAM